jgi:hypothetical protein
LMTLLYLLQFFTISTFQGLKIELEKVLQGCCNSILLVPFVFVDRLPL